MFRTLLTGSGLAGFALVATSTAAMAEINVGKPGDWAIWHQEPASALMAQIEWFSAYTLWGMAVPVSIFVAILIGWVIYRYSARKNPTPSKVTHNTAIEVVWTVVPVLILVAIAIPSFQLLSDYERPKEEVDLTIKTIGYQWYWGYEYQDGEEGNELAFDQRPLALAVLKNDFDKNGTFDDADIQAERASLGKEDQRVYPRKLAVDNEMVVPVGKTIRLLVTAGDVLHDWAMPQIGAKMDAVPGRLNEFTFTPAVEGIFYGQCSELCGTYHAFMPIGMRVVSEAQYAEWRKLAQTDIAAASKYIAEAQLASSIARAQDRERARETKTIATAAPVAAAATN